MSDRHSDLARGQIPLEPPNKKGKKPMKDIRKTIRFTADEFAQIEKKLNETGLTFSQFALMALTNKRIKMPIQKEQIRELNRIGNNLNQIARFANESLKLGKIDSVTAIQILSQLVSIEAQVNAHRKTPYDD